MNSVQLVIPGSSPTEESFSPAVRGKNGLEVDVSKDKGSFRKHLQEARQAKADKPSVKEKQDTVSDQTSQSQNTVDPGLSTAQAQSTQPASGGEPNDQQEVDATVGDPTVSLVNGGSISDSQQNLLYLVSLETPVAVDVQKTSSSSLPAAPVSEATMADAPVLAQIPVPADPAAFSTTVPAAPTELRVDVSAAETQAVPLQTGQTTQPAVEGQSLKTADNRSTDSQDVDLPVSQLSVQSERTTGKDQTTQKQGSEVKRIMEMESQRLTLNPLNTRGQKDSEAQTQTESDDSSSLAAFTHHPELELTKTGFKQTLDNQPLFRQQTLDAQDLMSQVVKKAELMIKQGGSEMNIQLKPEFLGKMTITVSMQDGVVTARFQTENQQVKNILDQNIQALRQNLEAQGMKVDKTEVNIQMDSGGMFGGFGGRQQELWQQQQGAQYSGKGTGRTGEAVTTASISETPVYNQVESLYGSGGDSVDYRI
ncbi:MAG TPA: flagellar hook-length control protein FliK [Syntrophomonadaceae bacterium]|nr:flagellar hook-length control protein FliK [Syntrophomonadaceae bacterium]